LQYAFLKTYARKHDCELQLPPWVGNTLFGCEDPPVTVNLPPRLEQDDCLQHPRPPAGDEYVNHDFRGYAQYHTSYYRPHRTEIRAMFRPVGSVAKRLRPALEKLFAGNHTVVGVHLRRGDYGRMSFYVTPVQWYLTTLSPQTAKSLGVDLGTEPLPHYQYLGVDLKTKEPLQMDFFPDWYLLSQSDVLLAPNSSFSFTAAMLGQCQRFFRSSLPKQGCEEIDPWDAYPVTHDKAEDYRHVPGVCLDETPYWKRLPDGKFQEKI
jgi:hypothetical protein